MALFNIDPFNPKLVGQIKQTLFAKRAMDDRPDAEPRKGNWWFANRTVNKKQQRLFTLNSETLGRLVKSDPIMWSILRTIKAFVNQAEWDIEADTSDIEQELDRWEEYALSHLSPYALGDLQEFHSDLLEKKMKGEIEATLTKIMAEGTAMHEKKKAIQWFFESITRQIRAEAESHRAPVRKLFETPSEQGIERNFRTLQDLVLDDILIYDAGCIVKNYSYGGELAELYHIPGKDVRLYRNDDRTIPMPPEAAYVWEDGGIIRAQYTKDELAYIMSNPQANGYGISPLEVAAYVITATIYADEYNIDFFKNSNVPPGVFDLGKDVTEDQRMIFQSLWENEVRGRGGLHRMLFMSGSEGAKFIPIRPHTNRDMQMIEYMKWTLAVKTACYGLSPQDIGFAMDFRLANTETQRDISSSRGIRTVMHLLQQNYNAEIVKKEFQWDDKGNRVQEGGHCDVKFAWKDIDLMDEEKQARIDAIDIQQGVISRNDRRKKLGMKPKDGGEALTVSGPVTPLTTLESSEEGQQDIDEQAAADEQAGGEDQDLTQTPQPGQPGAAKPQTPGAPKVGAPKANVNLDINRRQPLEKQHEMLNGVVKELQDKGVDATIKIGFSDGKSIEKDK